MLLYYHFSVDYAIVFVMNETRTETVLIPHPNELKKLADAQKKTLQAIQEICSDKVIWAPIFPLYVCEFDNNKKNTFDAEGKKSADVS